MRNKLFIICLLLVTSEIFAWTDADFKEMYDGCVETDSEISFKKTVAYCSCSVSLTTETFTVDQVQNMVNNETFSTHEEIHNITKYCMDKVFK